MQHRQQLAQLNNLTANGFDAFLYDCDGTLADNMDLHKQAFVKTGLAHGFVLDPSILDELAGVPTLEVATEISRRYGVAFNPAQFAQQKSQTFVDEFISLTKPLHFVVEHLRMHAGRKKIGVVSGGRKSTVSKTLRLLQIDHLVEVLVCADDTLRGKPFPDPFILAAQTLGVQPERCMVFEDGNPGVEAAKAAGMKWVRVDQI
jgi:HAD superfamily hydrolase (TIGR01509 family)